MATRKYFISLFLTSMLLVHFKLFTHNLASVNPRRSWNTWPTLTEKNRVQIGEHTYVVGLCKVVSASTEQSIALERSGNIEVFFRMLKSGVMYHCTSYSRATSGKHDNTYCCYRHSSDNSIHFGQIELFACTPEPYALLRELNPLDTTIIKQDILAVLPFFTIKRQTYLVCTLFQ